MSMNGNAKRLINTLEGLGFTLDGFDNGKRVYRHPNAPDKVLKVYGGIDDRTARKLGNAGAEIAGYSIAGESIPASISETARVKRQQSRAKAAAESERRTRELAPFQAAADRRAERLRESALIVKSDRRRREILDLMRPGLGRA